MAAISNASEYESSAGHSRISVEIGKRFYLQLMRPSLYLARIEMILHPVIVVLLWLGLGIELMQLARYISTRADQAALVFIGKPPRCVPHTQTFPVGSCDATCLRRSRRHCNAREAADRVADRSYCG